MQPIYRIKVHPLGGAIPDFDRGAQPGPLPSSHRAMLRELAAAVAEIAAAPIQETRRRRWMQHNRLTTGKPMLLVYPEDAWFELLPEANLRIEDPFWRQIEWYLRHLVYRDAYIDDDYVIEPDLVVMPVVRQGGWGLEPTYTKIREDGAFHCEPPMKRVEDLDKLRLPTFEYDEAATDLRMDRVGEVFDGILPVVFNGVTYLHTDPVGIATTLRGIEPLMLDLYDEPAFVHALMEHITEGCMLRLSFYEDRGLLRMNNRNHYTGSGGLGYTDELPAPGFDGTHVRLQDLWGFSLSQEFTDVSPAQHEEFLLSYQLRLLDRFGLSAYGCCEPYTHKFAMLERIRNLRRVSVSPWCDVAVAAMTQGRRRICSWKPQPAMLAYDFDSEGIRSYIGSSLEAMKENIVEVVLKDTLTVQGHPERIMEWIGIVRSEIERIHG